MFLPLLLPRGGDSTGIITIPHTAIISVLQLGYAIYGLVGEEVDSRIGGSGHVVKPGSGGKRFPSTLAGSNTADNSFAKAAGGGVGKRPMSSLSTVGAFHMVNSSTGGFSSGKQFLRTYSAHQHPAEPAVFRLRPLRMAQPAGAIALSWSRLLARLPHKV